MRLTVTLSELEKGAVIVGGTKDRRIEIEAMAKRRAPMAIIPVRNHDGKMISAIATTGAELTQRGLEVSLRPVWARIFLTCAAKKDTVIAMVCEFEFGKYWIDNNGVRKANLTTDGPGTDPKIVASAELELGRILESEERTLMVSLLEDLITRSF